MKKVIATLLKDNQLSTKSHSRLKILLLSFLLKINGKVQVNFDDFDDVKDHPLMEPFMHSFQDVFEQHVGDTPDNSITNKISAQDSDSEVGLFITQLNGLIDAMSATFEQGNGHTNIKIAAKDFPFAFDIDVESEELGKGCNLALKSILIPFV